MSKKNIHISLYFRLIISFILILISHNGFSQLFPADQNPPTLKWRQINTKNFQIIYPKETESTAQELANKLEHIIDRVGQSLHKKPKKISIILQNQGTSSNGFVQLAPRKSEFFMMPSQAFDFQNWINSLAVHELRHVVQFDKLTGGYNSPVFESIALAVFGITLPPWFYEGDAVNIETALTKAGRGKQPEWNIYWRYALLNDRKYSYSKDYFGSYKNFTPGYYQLGNYMNATLRNTYGDEVINDIFNQLKSNPVRLYNLTRSVKKITNLSTNQLHKKTAEELTLFWKNQLKTQEISDYTPLNKREKSIPENYLLPTITENNEVIFLKTSKAETPTLQLLKKDGQSEKLFRIGNQEQAWFSYAKNKIVWDEFREDSRYQQRSFNVINIYDLKSKKVKQLTHKTRLFAPAISPDATTIIAIEINTKNEVSLVEISAKNGELLKRYGSPQNYMLQMPSFSEDGQKVVVVGIANSGKTLMELDRVSGKISPLLPLQFQEILKPIYIGSQIVFKAHYNGIDNLYRFNRNDNAIYQITSAKFGAFNPSYDSLNNQLLFNNFGEGYDIAAINWNADLGKNINEFNTEIPDYNHAITFQEGNVDVFDSIPNHKYESKSYSDLHPKNMFYFHSLYPISGETISGLEIRSDNKMNTVGLFLNYTYDAELAKPNYAAGIEFKKYYPQLSFYYSNETYYISRGLYNPPVTGRQNIYNGQIILPVQFNQFNHNYRINLLSRISQTDLYHLNYSFKNLPIHKTTALYQLSASRSNSRASRDLASPFAQSISIAYRHHPFKQLLKGDIWTFKSAFYFPGILINHSLSATFNWQTQTGDYMDDVYIPRVSGYAFSKTLGNPYNSASVNYRFPIFYPDLEIGPLAYIKRVKAGFFSDFQNLGHGNNFNPKSFGAELKMDMNLLRFYLPNFELGERVIFLNEKTNQKPIFEFMLNYNL